VPNISFQRTSPCFLRRSGYAAQGGRTAGLPRRSFMRRRELGSFGVGIRRGGLFVAIGFALGLFFIVPASFGQSTKRLDPSGYFSFSGSAPSGFEDLNWIEFWMSENVHDPLSGSIRIQPVPGKMPWRDVPMISVTLFGRDVKFITAASESISYTFEGSFSRDGVYTEDANGEVVLTGELQKHRGGKIIAVARVDLTYDEGC